MRDAPASIGTNAALADDVLSPTEHGTPLAYRNAVCLNMDPEEPR